MHHRLPFHVVRKWNGHFFENTDLKDMGVVLHTGHQGSPCPNGTSINGGKIQIATPAEIFVHQVAYCACEQADGSLVAKDIQLLRIRLYPATSQNPSTAFSFDCLDDFHLQAVECKTAALKYIMKLRRMTSPHAPAEAPVSCCCIQY